MVRSKKGQGVLITGPIFREKAQLIVLFHISENFAYLK